MKLRTSRKWIALVLSALLLIPSFSLVSAAGSSSDISGHWAESNLEEWLDQGLLEGFEANVYKPNKDVTRAEFMTFINRAFGLTGSSSLDYKDVQSSTNKWYVKEISKAVKAGYVTGYEDNSIRPNNLITREEAAVMLANLVKGSKSSSVDLSGFSDADKISTWAKASVEKVFYLGYIAGYPNKLLKPQHKITRAESVVMINRAMEDLFTIYKKAGTYDAATGQDTIAGDVMITVADVTLKNTNIEGNLILGKGIREGDVTLDNVTVKGNTIVQGGGVNSIHIINSSLFSIIVDKATGVVRIVASGSSQIGEVFANSPAIFVEESLTGNGFGNITVTEQANGQIKLSGKFDKVIIEVPGVTVNVVSGTVNTLQVTTAATNTAINLAANATITNLNLNAATNVTGTGTVVNANVTASGVTFDQRPTNLVVTDGITVEIRATTPAPSSPPVGPVGPITPSTVRNVATEAELLAALADSNITRINMTNNIAATATVVIDRAVVLNGNGHWLDYVELINHEKPLTSGLLIQANGVKVTDLNLYSDDNPTEWNSSYGIHIYNATGVILDNVAIESFNAGVLVNASEVELTGVTDFFFNIFGGIEVSRGQGTDRNSLLKLSGVILHETEYITRPTIWIENGEGSVEGWNTQLIETEETSKDQTLYYLNVYNEAQLRAAVAQEELKKISLGASIDLTSSLVIDRENVTLDGTGTAEYKQELIFNELRGKEKPYTSGLIIQADGVTVTNLRISSRDNQPFEWFSSYGIQVYDAEGITLNNLDVRSFNAAILVNASQVVLTGTTNLSYNGLGGIEVGKGEGTTLDSVLTVGANAAILNTTETESKPTIWVAREADGVTDQGTVVGWNTQLIEAEGTNDEPQTFYYLNVYNEAQLRTAVDQVGLQTISLANDIYLTSSLVINRADVTLNGNWKGIEFFNLENSNPGGIIIQANGVTVSNIWIELYDPRDFWFSSYGIQVYNATGVTLNTVDIQNFNAAILVNGSEVELTGVMYVSYNDFGGIEVSKGAGMTRDSLLTLTGTIVNKSESYTRPTVWVVNNADGIPQGVFNYPVDTFTLLDKSITEKYYYLKAANAIEPI